MHIGKAVRMERLCNRATGRSIIMPMDHGVTVGPLPGLTNVAEAVSEAAEGGVNAVLMHKGLVRCGHRKSGRDVGLIMHLSAGSCLSPSPNSKVLVATVEEAVRCGADGVSVHVNMGDAAEGAMLADLGRVAREADDWGMPLLAMVYARGARIGNPFSPELVAHCARLAGELGADMVKVPYTGDKETFRQVTEGSCIPVLIAGGEKVESAEEVLRMAYDSLAAGGFGLSVGRNLFQHSHPRRLARALAGIVHEGWNVEVALDSLEQAGAV